MSEPNAGEGFVLGSEQWASARDVTGRLIRDPKFLATIESALREVRIGEFRDDHAIDVRVEGGLAESFGWSDGGEVALVGPAAAVAAVAVAVIPLAVGP